MDLSKYSKAIAAFIIGAVIALVAPLGITPETPVGIALEVIITARYSSSGVLCTEK